MDNKSTRIRNYVRKKIFELNSVKDDSKKKRNFAILRRNVGEYNGDLEVFGIIFDGADEDLYENENSFYSIYTALTLYAFLKNNKEKMESLGVGVARLAIIDKNIDKVLNRFNHMAMSKDKKILSYNIRQMMKLIADKDIDVDYAKLASDIYIYLYDPVIIRRNWAKDFYRTIQRKED